MVASSASASGTRILVVEDEAIVAKDLEDTLERFGYAVTAVAGTGDEAVTYAERTRPDLVLMDIVLRGETDGIEAARRIRDRIGVPVIYLTAFARGELLERAKATEPEGYLLKPFREGELRAAIEIALSRKRRREDLAERFRDAPFGYHAVDADGFLVEVNETELAWLGYSREEIVEKRRIRDLLTAASRGVYDELLAALEARGWVRDVELEFVRRDGSTFPALVRVSAARREPEKNLHSRSIVIDLCERKQAEATQRAARGDLERRVEERTAELSEALGALAESERRLQAFMDRSPAVAFMKDEEGRYAYVNGTFERIFETSRADLVGQTDAALFPPDVVAELRAHDREVLDADRPAELEEILPTPDGARRTWWVMKFPFRDAQGRRFLGGMALDKSDRARAQARERLQLAVTRALSLASTVAEATPEVLRAMCQHLGWEVGSLWLVDSGAEVLRCVGVDSLPGAGAPAFEARTRQAVLKRGEGLPGRVWASGTPALVPDATGDPRAPSAAAEGLLSGCAFPIVDGPETIGVVELFRRDRRSEEPDFRKVLEDVGARLGQFLRRKQAEEELERLTRQYTLLLNAAGEGIYAIDLEGRVTFANPAAARMLGWDPADLLGRAMHDLVHHHRPDGSPYPAEECPIYAAFREGAARHVYGEAFFRKDGTSFPVEYVSTPIFVDGQVAGAVVVFKDATERRALEEQLLHAQKMEAVGRLAGGVAHDFNNVLTVILSCADLLASDIAPDNPEVEEIRQAARRAAGLTRQLLAFSRRQILEPRVLDLNEVLGNLEKMIRRIVGEDIDVRVSLAPDLGSVRADPGQIEQVVMNLVVNARDAMPRGGKLVLETANVDLDASWAREHVGVSPGRYVMLAVRDTGVGMDAGTKARIFEPFFTTKERGKGTGLGLSTVHGIVKQSGGEIDVCSELGRGTTFHIYLPRVDEPPEKPRARRAAGDLVRGTETILLVEDEASLLAVVKRQLDGLGYRVLEAASGEEALEIAREHTPIHALITDMVLPGIHGLDLANAVRALHPGIRVLCMSGYTDRTLGEQAFQEEGGAFLQKPFTPTALATKLRELLES